MRCDMCGKRVSCDNHYILYVDKVSEDGQETFERIYLCEPCYAILENFMNSQFIANIKKWLPPREEKTIAPTVTDKQSKYILQLTKKVAAAENKSIEEIGKELFQKYGKKLEEMIIGEASEVIEYLQDRLNKAKAKKKGKVGK